MAIIKKDNRVENNGENNGVLATNIYGNITFHNDKNEKFPSLIPVLIEKLAEITNVNEEELEKNFKIDIEELREYKIEDKIEYNNVIKYKDIIDEYSEYGAICECAFNAVDDNNMGIKRKILRSINTLYKKAKGQLLKDNKKIDQMDIIRQNSDEIIECVIDTLTGRIHDDNQGKNIIIEDIEDGLSRIICYAFIDCKILEKPR